MLRNSVFSKSLLLFFVLLFTLTCLNAESQTTTTVSQFNTAITVVNSVEGEIGRAIDTLGQFNAIRGDILTMLKDNNEDRRENIINSNGLAAAVSSSINGLGDFLDGIELNNALNGINASIETFIRNDIDRDIFQRQGNEDGTVGVCKVFGMNIMLLLYLDTNICPKPYSLINISTLAQH